MPRKNYSKKRSIYNPAGHPPVKTGCAGKNKFPTEKQALDAIFIQSLQQPKLVLSTYQCEFCQKWHLTSTNNLDAQE